MSEKAKRKIRYWLIKIWSIIVACGLPIYAVCEHFPLWVESHGATRSAGAGLIIILIVIAVVFRKAVFEFLIEKMNLRHAPPLMIWLVMLILSYILLYINQFIPDLTTVFWFGLVGCALGNVLTFIAETLFGKRREDDNG